MKKKIVFVIESLGIGGAEKSLVTLLSELNYLKYEVDLFLFNSDGEFMNLIPKEVNVIKIQKEFLLFNLKPIQSLKELIKIKKYKIAINKFLYLIKLAVFKYILKKEYIGWNHISKSLIILEKKYDAAVGFLEKKSIYFVVDKIKANKKIGWIHTDYEKIEHDHKLDNIYFKKLDNIVTVSSHCKEVLLKEFPMLNKKIKIIQNIISPALINKMAENELTELEGFDKSNILICTVCRLIQQKGIDIAITCCENLVSKGLSFKWIIIGDGSEKEKLQKIINEKNLQNNFILMGSKVNPYPYIKKSNIYVQPSRVEGFGITVAEAKVLNKPIIVSNIPEFKEQIVNNTTGLIYKDIKEMCSIIELVIKENNIRNELSENLNKLNMDNSHELKKLEKLF